MSESKNINEIKKIRVFYKKRGRLKYISHLDIVRCFERAIKRSKIKVWFTKGFNPHPYLTFAIPTSLGFRSNYEILDLKIEGKVNFKKIRGKLKKSLPSGLEIIKVDYPKDAIKNIGYAEYIIKLKCKNSLKEIFNKYVSKDKIIVSKKTKSGIKDINIKEYIKEIDYSEIKNGIEIRIVLPAGNLMINPNLLINQFIKENKDLKIETNITKNKVLDTQNKLFE